MPDLHTIVADQYNLSIANACNIKKFLDAVLNVGIMNGRIAAI